MKTLSNKQLSTINGGSTSFAYDVGAALRTLFWGGSSYGVMSAISSYTTWAAYQ